MSDVRRPLFERFPGTRALPWVPLALLPTPVQRCDALAEEFGSASLWVKRDDVSGERYGGNKVRKLEFLLGDALAAGATDVITFGAVGSNHALATAIYGAAQGIKVHSMLMPQPNASYVRRNLLASTTVEADVNFFGDRDEALRGAAGLREELLATDRLPFVIPFGGTSPGSAAGFVNAAFELAEQVDAGELPEPDVLFVALGSMGTAADLTLGLRVAGLKTVVAAVPVLSEDADVEALFVRTIFDAQTALHVADDTFPVFEWAESDVRVVRGFLGDGYASFTSVGMEAVEIARRVLGLPVEGTYTGKTLSALLARGRAGALRGAHVLFWDTYNSRDISPLVGAGNEEALPPGSRSYLEADVQELDRG
jgi:1-aminocyclopropane-1-carboxylate deaminase/D-cysteine desulfhydrase-like pyridoxal-dependent ACC family enzyme